MSIDVEALRGVADSGNLADDVTDLLVACGEAARDRGTGIVLAVDELQYVRAEELSALIVAVHRTKQLNLPVILTGAGAPQLRALAGEAKSYAERLFDFPEIGSLGPEDARPRLPFPPRRVVPRSTMTRSTSWSSAPMDTRAFSRNGAITSGMRRRRARSRSDDVERAAPRVRTSLTRTSSWSGFDRLTPREREYLVARRRSGPGPHRSGERAALGVRVESVAPRRSAIDRQGIIYSPAHGDTAFTVPLFDEFLKRVEPRL